MQDFERVTELDSDFEHTGLSEQAGVFLSLERWQDAVTALTRALQIDPTCQAYWVVLAQTYTRLHPRDQIARLLREMKVWTSKPETVLLNRAIAMKNAALYGEAVIEFSRILERFPDNTTAMLLKGETHVAMRNYEQALSDLEYALTSEAQARHLLCVMRGLILSHLGRYAEAIESCTQGLKAEPDDYLNLYAMAVAQARWKGPSSAQDLMNRARAALTAALNTDAYDEALYGLAGLEALVGNTDQAFEYLEQSSGLESIDPQWAHLDVTWLDLHGHTRFQEWLADI